VSLDSGDDLTARFHRETPDGAELGRQLLGVGREIYTNTACISRAEVIRLEDPGAIKEALLALADSAQPERTAQKVLDRLRQERIAKVGRPRGRTGPIHELAARLAELERSIAGARQTRAAVDELAQKQEAVAALTDAELAVVRTLDAAVLAARLEEASRRLEQVRQLEQSIAEEQARQRAQSRFAAFPRHLDDDVRRLRSHLRATQEAEQDFQRRAAEAQAPIQQLEEERGNLAKDAHQHQERARGLDEAALKEEPAVRELVSALTFSDAQAPEAHLRAHACAEEVQQIAERQPGMIGAHLDWIARRIEFERVYSEWQERHNAAVDARRRAGMELPPRLEQLKKDITRYKEVPDVIKAAQLAEEAMRREEAMAERARARYGTFGILLLGSVLLTAVAFLVAFVGLQIGIPIFLASSFLLGMGVLGAVIAIWMRGASNHEVDRRLKFKDHARLRRREILAPWGVRASGELQQALVDHLHRVRHDATRLELDRQAQELEDRAQAASRALRELVGSWGIPQPAPIEEAFAETVQRIRTLSDDTTAWNAAQQRWQEAARGEASLDQRREGLRQQLHNALDRLGFDRREALAAGHEYLDACESARRAQQLQTRVDQLDAQLDRLRHPAQRSAGEHEKAREYARLLGAIYGPAGITDPDLEAAAGAWDEAVAGADAYQAVSARLEQLGQQRAAIAGDEETQALQRLHEDLSQQLETAMVGCDPQAVAEYQALPLAELERQRDQHRATKERAHEERARAEELLNDRLLQLQDLASMEEEIATTREQLQELEVLAQAYDLAIDTLEGAAKTVRRAVVPQLKAHLQGQLAPITNGRYREIRVSDDLGLQVKAADQRVYRDLDSLSLGTRSLIYLLQRVALARIISRGVESLPLLLDEALVHADRRRLKAALDELARLGQEHQIILFSKDEALAERGERAGNWTIIRLPGPSLAVAAGQPERGPDGHGRPEAVGSPQDVVHSG